MTLDEMMLSIGIGLVIFGACLFVICALRILIEPKRRDYSKGWPPLARPLPSPPPPPPPPPPRIQEWTYSPEYLRHVHGGRWKVKR